MLFPGFARFGGGAVTISAGPSEASLPTYVGAGTQDAVPSIGQTVTPIRNAGWQAGDYELIQVTTEHAQTLATPSGVTKLLEVMPGDTSAGYFRKLYVFGRVLASGSSDLSMSLVGVSNRVGWCSYIFGGVYAAEPIDGTSQASEIGVAMSCPSITATGGNRMIVGFSAIDGCASYTNANLASITERKDAIVNDVGLSAWTGTRVASGAIGATTWNGPNTDGISIGMVALRPA